MSGLERETVILSGVLVKQHRFQQQQLKVKELKMENTIQNRE